MEKTLNHRPVVSVIGGGQLARMMQESAIALGIELRALVEATNGSTGQVTVVSYEGQPNDGERLEELVHGADVLTFEHEHIPHTVFEQLRGRIRCEPAASALIYAQNKLAMREKMTELGIACPRWSRVRAVADIDAFGHEIGWPVIVKTPTGGYDGHGVKIVHSGEEVLRWFDDFEELLVEEKVPFTSEIAALLARNPSGEIRSWPVATTEQRHGVCSVVTAPASGVQESTRECARLIGEKIAQELSVTGVLAVEMFVVGHGHDERILVNELAMRPHNTGHWTIDGAVTSQFEQHLRAVLDLPLGDTSLVCPGAHAVMVNLLGSQLPDPAGALALAMRRGGGKAKIHLYGKEVRPGRKLGHVTVVDDDSARARAAAEEAVAALFGE